MLQGLGPCPEDVAARPRSTGGTHVVIPNTFSERMRKYGEHLEIFKTIQPCIFQPCRSVESKFKASSCTEMMTLCNCDVGISINGGSPKWRACKGKSHLETDDLGVPLFQETPMCL